MGTDVAMEVKAQPGACSLWIALTRSTTTLARIVLPAVRVNEQKRR